MTVTFNQIPTSPVFYTYALGYCMFTTREDICETIQVHREDCDLHMTFNGFEFHMYIADESAEIDNLLLAFWDMFLG